MRKTVVYVSLTFLMLLVIGPFIWMVSTSLKPDGEVLSATPHLIPSLFEFSNYKKAWDAAPFGKYFWNSLLISGIEVAFDVTFGAMAAYAFARIDFIGKRVLFLALLSTMMVPAEVLLIPNYITISNFHWLNTYQGLIVPWLVSIFTIFLMRQFFMSLPNALFEAAEIDGCHPMRTLFQIILPVSKPIWITTALIKFVGAWNSFLWVLIVSNSADSQTLTVGIMSFASDQGTVYNLLMAAATFSMVPLVVLFLVGQRYFIEGIARTGVK